MLEALYLIEKKRLQVVDGRKKKIDFENKKYVKLYKDFKIEDMRKFNGEGGDVLYGSLSILYSG